MTQEQSILFLLREGPKETGDFIRSVFHLSAEYRRAVSNLRKKGCRITAKRLARGRWLYTLESEPAKLSIDPTGQMVAFA